MSNAAIKNEISSAEVFKAAGLRQRVITAVVIAAVFIAIVSYSTVYCFQIAISVLFAVAAWEWANLAGFTRIVHKITYVCILLVVACLLQFTTPLVFFPLQLFTNPDFFYWLWVEWLMVVAVIFWFFALLLLVTYPRSQAIFASCIVRAIIGLFVLVPTWAGVVFLKQQHEAGGLVLWVVVIIALADIGAYFVGVRFGKHKLASLVSPGKSWEGVLGGVLCNGLLVTGVALYWHLTMNEIFSLCMVTAVVVVFSVVGDLFESMMKRQCGIKDSGSILPGHGGILDRIDGWMAAVPVFTLAYIAFAV